MHVYTKTESKLWTVGFYDPTGRFHTDSDHDDKELAAGRVNFLNGGQGTVNTKLLAACKCAEADLWGLVSDYMDIDIETSDEPQAKTIRELKAVIKAAERR